MCWLLGIQKLNTIAYHPQCDGMVKWFNHTLKSMLRKHATTLAHQWDRNLQSVLWAYRNTSHESIHEIPSFLLFGMDCHLSTETALLPLQELNVTNVSDYREHLMLSCHQPSEMLRKAQKRYKIGYDNCCHEVCLDVGDWILIKFPQGRTGSCPNHGMNHIEWSAIVTQALCQVRCAFPRSASMCT